MKSMLELGNRYAAKSDWKDFALTKFCVCAIGVMIGVNIPARHKKIAVPAAAGVFAATYLPLMRKVFEIGREMLDERK